MQIYKLSRSQRDLQDQNSTWLPLPFPHTPHQSEWWSLGNNQMKPPLFQVITETS